MVTGWSQGGHRVITWADVEVQGVQRGRGAQDHEHMHNFTINLTFKTRVVTVCFAHQCMGGGPVTAEAAWHIIQDMFYMTRVLSDSFHCYVACVLCHPMARVTRIVTQRLPTAPPPHTHTMLTGRFNNACSPASRRCSIATSRRTSPGCRS